MAKNTLFFDKTVSFYLFEAKLSGRDPIKQVLSPVNYGKKPHLNAPERTRTFKSTLGNPRS
jgi:hypothetical protein